MPNKKNMPTSRPNELSKLMQQLVIFNLSVPTRLLIEWQVLTLMCPSKASGEKWDEINFLEIIWKIPAELTKDNCEYIVPLSSRSILILEVMKAIRINREIIAPSKNNLKLPMMGPTTNSSLKRIGYGGKLVSHGLRSIASTALNETGLNSDVKESALSHANKNKDRRGYIGLIYVKQRTELMDLWGRFSPHLL